MSKLEKKATGTAVLCAVLMLCLVICHFLPFWSDVSIHGMIWFPTDHEAEKAFIQQRVGEDFAVDDLLAMPILSLIFCAVGIVVAFKSESKLWMGIAGALCGGCALLGYLTEPAFRTGNLWGLHLLLSVCVLLSAALAIYTSIKLSRDEA